MKKFLVLTLMCVLGLFNLSAQEPETIVIGNGGDAINYSPSYIDSYTSVTQQIFVAEEMQNKSGKIQSVSFKCTSRTATRTFKVYMVNTNKTSFSGVSDWVALTSQDLVFEGSVSFSADNWTTITFQTPFTYKKGMNVLLCVNDVTGTSSSLVTKFASDTKSENRTLHARAWNSNYGDATNITEEGTLSTSTNHVEFTIVNDGSGEELDPAPAAPTNLATEALSDSQIRLTWNASENATSYKVYQRDIEEAIATVTTTSYVVEGLEAETGYCYTVTAVKDQESEKSDEVCQVTQAKPAAPSTFAFDFNGGTSAGFRVFQGNEASHLCPNWGTPSEHSTILEAQLKLQYFGVDGSVAVYSTTYDMLEDTYHTPDNYIVTENAYLITETSTLEWDVRQREAGKEDQYAIVVSEDNTNFEMVWFERYSNTTGETKAYSLKDYAGKELYIGFRHYQQTNGDAIIIDNINLVTESSITPVDPIDPTAPTIPDNVKAFALGDSKIKLTWDASENTTKYNVYKGEEVIATVTETNYTVEGLEAETTYCFTVTAANEEKESAKSSEVCATTEEAAPLEAPAAPANLKATQDTETTLRLTWDAVANADTYNVYQDAEKIITVTETTHLVTGLQADIEYCFTVTAVNAAGESAKSNEVCATTTGNGNEDQEVVLVAEDFEDYIEGDYLAQTGASYWTTWSNKPGTKEDAKIAVLDGNKCAYMTYGVDQVLLLGGYQSGTFDLEFEVLVPNGSTGYLNVLHEFAGNNSKWALQAYLQATDTGDGNPVMAPGHGSVHAGSAETADIPCVYDAWMHFRIHVDADTDVAQLYYTMPNGEETKACEWQWSQDTFGEAIAGRKLDAMNFFPMNAQSEYYVDNISLTRIGGETSAELTFDKESVEVTVAKNDMTTVELTVENTGNSIAEYVAWVDYGMGENSSKDELVSYSDEEMANASSFGFNSSDNAPVTLEIAAFFPASAYANSVMGTRISQAAYFLGEFVDEAGNLVPSLEEGTGFTFRIYGQGSNGYPGKVLAEKEIPAEEVKLDWNVVSFDEPVELTGFDFYLAVEMTQCVGGASLVCDGSKDASLKGISDLVRFGQGAFRSVTSYTVDGQFYGNWHLMLYCVGNPVVGGWAELNEKEIYLPIGESTKISFDVTTVSLKANQTYNADLVLSSLAEEEDIRIPITLNVGTEDVEELLSNTYSIYPNPTKGMVTVEGENIDYIAVYNSVGQLVKVVKTQSNVVDMSECENGVYFFNIVNYNKEISIQQVIVNK